MNAKQNRLVWGTIRRFAPAFAKATARQARGHRQDVYGVLPWRKMEDGGGGSTTGMERRPTMGLLLFVWFAWGDKSRPGFAGFGIVLGCLALDAGDSDEMVTAWTLDLASGMLFVTGEVLAAMGAFKF